jgi:hypothetical protein
MGSLPGLSETIWEAFPDFPNVDVASPPRWPLASGSPAKQSQETYPQISQITQIKRYVKETGNLRAGLGFSPTLF